MSVQCTKCHFEIKSGRTSGLSNLVCERCGSKVDSGYSTKINGSVGIHPALARRYDEISTEFAKQQVVPSKVPQRSPQNLDIELPKIPGYEIIERIGKGAMGSVFRAIHQISGREAAVKILSSELVARDDLVARFEREAAALRSFRHPNIVAIFDSGSVQNIHYYSMEYVVGTNLRKYIRSGAMLPKVAIRFARQIAKALNAAHQRGIIHRDLKPENILIEGSPDSKLDGSERLVLVDFGLAGILNESADPHPNLTHSRVSMGTINYMAPEQHIDAKRADHRTDLYACGVILYECITGDLPLGRFAMPGEKGVNVPPSLDACLIKALARSADERFQSAEKFDQALASIEIELASNSFESSQPPQNSDESDDSEKTVFPTVWMQSPPWLKRPRLIGGAVALCMFLAAGLTILSNPPREVAVSKDGAVAVSKSGKFNAPIPDVRQVNGATIASLGLMTKISRLEQWESESPAWSYENNRIGYFALQGDKGHFRRDFSFGTSKAKLKIKDSFSYTSQIFFERLVLPIDLIKAEQIARERLGGNLQTPSGGLFLINKKERRAIGMTVSADGTCAMSTIRRSGASFEEVRSDPRLCQSPLDGKSLGIKLVCNAKTNSCTGFVGAKKISTQMVEGLGASDWYLSLGCRNINCLFEPDSKKKT